MQIQHQKGMPPIIPKDPINDHMTYSVTKKYHSTLCLQPLQRNQDLPFATVDLHSLHSANANPHTIHKTFAFTHASIDKSKSAIEDIYLNFKTNFVWTCFNLVDRF